MRNPLETNDTLLVTGGAGFIGSNFVRHVLDHRSARIVVVDKLTYAGNEANLEGLAPDRFSFVRADIADQGAMRKLHAELRPRAVVNLAAETHVDRSIDGPDAFVQTNVVGSVVLLEAARELLSQLPGSQRDAFRFLQVSTDEVFGSLSAEGSFSESSPYAPSSPYSASKAAADHFVRAYHRTFGLPTLITNCANNYGPHQFPEKLIPLMLLNALEGRDLPLYGDGLQVRDWLHVDDHCAGILAVLEGGSIGESYNIGANEERTNLEIVDALCAAIEEIRPAARNAALQARGVSRYTDLKVHVGDRPGHDRRYAIDSKRIRSELGWRPARDLSAGLRETVAWYLDHGDWCEAIQASRYQRERLGLGAS